MQSEPGTKTEKTHKWIDNFQWCYALKFCHVIKTCSAPLTFREIQIEASPRFCLTPIRIVTMKDSQKKKKSNAGEIGEKKKFFYLVAFVGDVNSIPAIEISVNPPQTIKNRNSFGPSCTSENLLTRIKFILYSDICILMHIAEQFRIAKLFKWPVSSTDEWVKKMCSLYTSSTQP